MAGAPKPERRRTRAEQRASTLKLILDTSEELFSQLGYFGVTIKDVADKMGTHAALIFYYFDGKKALFDAVFERRVKFFKDDNRKPNLAAPEYTVRPAADNMAAFQAVSLEHAHGGKQFRIVFRKNH